MNRLIIALATTAALSTGAFAQTTIIAKDAPAATTAESTSKVPVPGNTSGIDSTMPAEAASTVVVPGDAPTASTDAGASQVPVPGNTSGIDSTMPAAAASTVVVPRDAAKVPGTPASPVPGNSQGETAIPAN